MKKFLSLFIALAAMSAQAMQVADLRCEFRNDPVGIDVAQPRLSWILKSDARGQRQAVYQIVVESAGAQLWDSGRVASDESVLIPYAGKPLASLQQVTWKVRTWDQDGKPSDWSKASTWTMGVLNDADWHAKWIGASKQVAAPQRAARGYHAAEAKRGDEEKWVQIDLGKSQPIASIRLYPMRHEGKDGFGFPLRFKVEAANEPAIKDAMMIASRLAADVPNPGVAPVAFDAKGASARYVRVTATKLGKFTASYCFALSQVEVVSDGRNVAKGAPVTAKDSVDQWGWGKVALTDGALGTHAPEQQKFPTVMLRREVMVKSGLRRAIANVCGLGEYELTLNGAKVGDDLLSSGWTKYDKTCLYDTRDITAALRAGKNEVALLLGNGMYNVVGGRYTKLKGSFGPPKAIAQVQLEYADGTTEIIGTDAQWQVSPGPITFSCVFGGEDFDARWVPQWEPAKIVSGPGGALKGLSCSAPPIRAFDVLKASKLNDAVYDTGQNVALMPRITVKGPAGSTVKISPSELIKADGSLDDTMCGGNSYWKYTLAGSGDETWFPKFFYRGARYLKVECGGGAEIKSIEGVVVHSSSAPVGEFACSSELFNRIHTLVRWAQRSNMMSVLTDCPHREKLGWLEQYHLNGPSLRYEFDLAALFTKGMNDMADSQLANGLVPDIAPEYVQFSGGFRDSPEWGSAFILAAWQQYEFNADGSLLRRHFDAMQRYVDYLGSKAQGHIIDYGLGDWYDIGPKAPGYAQLTPKALTATAIYYEVVVALAKSAQLLGRAGDAQKLSLLAAQIRDAFNARFFNAAEGSYATGAQTANAMPLVLGLVDPSHRERVVASLVNNIREKGLTAGDVGYRYVLRALADNGRSDVVFEVNNQSEKPGYGFQLKKGATSLTEAWNAGRGSSQNHFMLGQINEWFYHDLAGIQCDPEGPGFKKIVIKPAIVGNLTRVNCAFESPRGRIASNWKRDNGKLSLAVTIPANTTATVFIPGKNAHADGAKILRTENSVTVFETGSGSYTFTAEL